MGELKLNQSNKVHKEDFLRINRDKKKINGTVRFYKYRDKDTRQIVIYIPSLELSGYGITEKKAIEMIKFSIGDFCKYLVNSAPRKMEEELKKLGWEHIRYKNKQFSKSYIDSNGELQNFNAVANEVEVREAVLAY